MLQKFAPFIATGFGSGYLPKAPGTWGSLVGLLLVFLTLPFGMEGLAFLTVLSVIIGIWSSTIVMKDLEDPDPSIIVIDEIAGIFLTFLLIACFNGPLSLFHLGLGFCTFRLFDIWKPFPISWVDQNFAKSKKYAPIGVMLDDLLAALPAAFVVLVIIAAF